MTPGIILALFGGVSILLSVILHHRRETSAMYLSAPRSGADAAWNAALERAASMVELTSHYFSGSEEVRAFGKSAATAIRAARRGGR